MENTVDYLRRRVYDEILAWKNDLSDRTVLLIDGARRVGKTSLIPRLSAIALGVLAFDSAAAGNVRFDGTTALQAALDAGAGGRVTIAKGVR